MSIKPMVATPEGAASIVDRHADTISAGQEIRELYQNSKDAKATRVDFTLSEPGRLAGRELLACIDNGAGFTEKTVADFGVLSKPELNTDNFGIGAKISLAEWNPDGIVIVSKNPANTSSDFTDNTLMAVFVREGNEYGLLEEDGEFCFAPWEYGGVDFSTCVIPGDSGTIITLMGSKDRPSTFRGSPKSDLISSKDRWITSYLQLRYERFDGVKVTERFKRNSKEDLLKYPATDSAYWHTASPTGFGDYIFGITSDVRNSPSESIVAHGLVNLDGADVRWALKKNGGVGEALEDSRPYNEGVRQYRLPPGAEMKVVNGEAVEVTSGSPGLSGAWGLDGTYGKRLYFAIYPHVPVKMSSSRDQMLTTNGMPLPIDEWRREFKEDKFPSDLLELLESERIPADSTKVSEYAITQMGKHPNHFMGWKYMRDGVLAASRCADRFATRIGLPHTPSRPVVTPGGCEPRIDVNGKKKPLGRSNNSPKPVSVSFVDVLSDEDDGRRWGDYSSVTGAVRLSRAFLPFQSMLMGYRLEVKGPGGVTRIQSVAEDVYAEYMTYKVSHYLADYKTVGADSLSNDSKTLDAMFYGHIPERKHIASRLGKGIKLPV